MYVVVYNVIESSRSYPSLRSEHNKISSLFGTRLRSAVSIPILSYSAGLPPFSFRAKKRGSFQRRRKKKKEKGEREKARPSGRMQKGKLSENRSPAQLLLLLL